LSPGRSRR